MLPSRKSKNLSIPSSTLVGLLTRVGKRSDEAHGILGDVTAGLDNILEKTGAGTDRVALEDLADSITGNVQDLVTDLEEISDGILARATKSSGGATTEEAAERAGNTAEVVLTLFSRGSRGSEDSRASGEDSSENSEGSHFDRVEVVKTKESCR